MRFFKFYLCFMQYIIPLLVENLAICKYLKHSFDPLILELLKNNETTFFLNFMNNLFK